MKNIDFVAFFPLSKILPISLSQNNGWNCFSFTDLKTSYLTENSTSITEDVNYTGFRVRFPGREFKCVISVFFFLKNRMDKCPVTIDLPPIFVGLSICTNCTSAYPFEDTGVKILLLLLHVQSWNMPLLK